MRKKAQYQFILENDNFIVRDHRVHDVRILPGVTFLDVIYRFGQQLFGHCNFELQAILFKAPIATTESWDKKVRVIFTPQLTDSQWQVTIQSQPIKPGQAHDEDWDENAECQLTLVKSHQQKTTSINDDKALAIDPQAFIKQATDQWSMEGIYQLARQVGVEHRTFMKTAGVVYRQGDEELMHLKLNALAEEFRENFYAHPAFLDGATFAGSSGKLAGHDAGVFYGQMPYIPISIQRFRAYSALPSEIYVYSRGTTDPHPARQPHQQPDVISNDITLFNQQGLVLAEFHHLSLKRIRSPELIQRLMSSAASSQAPESIKWNSPVKPVAKPEGVGADNQTQQQVVDTDLLKAQTQRYLQKAIGKVLAKPSDQVGINTGFYSLGLDSTQLLYLVKQLEQGLAASLYPTLLFEYTTIHALSDYLIERYSHALANLFQRPDADHSPVEVSGQNKASLDEPREVPENSLLEDKTWCFAPKWQVQSLAKTTVANPIAQRIILCHPSSSVLENLSASFGDGVVIVQPVVHESIATDFRHQFDLTLQQIQGYLQGPVTTPLALQVLGDFRGDNCYSRALAGLLRTAQQENPLIHGQIIGIDDLDEYPIEVLASLLKQEAYGYDRHRIQVHYRGKSAKQRYIERLVPVSLGQSAERSPLQASQQPLQAAEPVVYREQGVYLITGGLGGLGYHLAQALAQTARVRLVLVGRSVLNQSGQAKLEQLRQRGSEVTYISTDISQSEAVQALVSQIKQDYGQLNGIFHSAGVIRDSVLLKKKPQEIDDVFGSKVHGLCYLDQATQTEPLDFFLLYSSISAVTGNLGQADYASANGFMDIFAQVRNQRVKAGQRSGQTITINWPLWQEGGMSLPDELVSMIKAASGMTLLPTSAGLAVLTKALYQTPTQWVICQGNESQIRQHLGLVADKVMITSRGEQADIAIVGLAGSYPMAQDIAEFSRNLRAGRDCITAIPKDRWDSTAFSYQVEDYYQWGGFIGDIDKFDPLFFNISPRQAEIMDPQARLFLQTAWAACEDAGVYFDRNAHGSNPVGVFVGAFWSHYELYSQGASQGGQPMAFGNSLASIANMVSYSLNLHGPSIALDTMCSSALTSIHLACESIRRQECQYAIAGGVNVVTHPHKYLFLKEMEFLSSDGRCRSFGDGGDGYVPGEGVGAVLLTSLENAEAAGHSIYGVIKGSSINHVGKTSGAMVPSPHAQAELISAALTQTGVDPRTISYVEAHGTGTRLGDPIEVQGLQTAFKQWTSETQYCALGSSKSNIGHLEAAAGVAGLTKILLQLKYQEIFPTLHAETLNRHILLEESPFYLPKALQPWPRPEIIDEDGETSIYPRRSGVSAFGANGSNAHLIIEEYIPLPAEEQEKPLFARQGSYLIVLSAQHQTQLRAVIVNLLQALTEVDDHRAPDIGDIAYTLQVGREAMDERLGLLVRSTEELKRQLTAYLQDAESVNGFYRGTAKPHNDMLALFATDEDLQAAMADWIAKGKYEKLLSLWVNGLRVDWHRLYGAVKPRRVSLPTYPIVKERYWVETNIPDKDKSATVQRAAYFMRKNWTVSPVPMLALAGSSPAPLQENKHSAIIIYNQATTKLAEALAKQFHQALPLAVTAIDDEMASIEQFISHCTTWLDLSGVFQDELPQAPGSFDWIRPLQALLEHKRTGGICLLQVTQGLESCQNASTSPAGAQAAGLYRMLQAEYPAITSKHLDLDPKLQTVSELVSIILQEIALEGREIAVCYRGQQRFVPALEVQPLLAVKAPKNRFSPDQVLLITGGTQGLGLLCARHLVAHYGVKQLVLTGREVIPPKGEWNRLADFSASLQQKIQAIQGLEDQGVTVRVLSLALVNQEAVVAEIKAIETTMGPIAGLIHAAGTADAHNPAFIRKSVDSMSTVLSPKVQGTLNLLQSLNPSNLAFALLFSSISAEIPSLAAGQSDYAMANAFMDYIAQANHQGLPVVSIQWPSWKDTGMGEVKSQAYQNTGLLSITDQEGLAFLDNILAQLKTPLIGSVIAPVIVNSVEFKAEALLTLPNGQHSPIKPSPAKNTQKNTVQITTSCHHPAANPLLTDSAKPRLYAYLQGLVEAEAKLKPGQLDVDTPFANYGIDSIILTQILRKLQQALALELEPSILLEYSTLAAFGDWLIRSYPVEIAGIEGGLPAKPDPEVLSTSSAGTATVADKRNESTQEELQAQPQAESSQAAALSPKAPIAVIGMACRFPGAEDVEAYWQLLAQGQSALQKIPKSHWGRQTDYYAGLLNDVYGFDPEFFQLPVADVQHMDPQALVLLEESLKAFYHAGYTHQSMSGSNMGVYIGGRAPVPAAVECLDKARNPMMIAGQNYLAANLAQFFNLQGPALVVDTACSSALVAMKMATDALQAGATEMALVGGVSLLTSPTAHEMFTRRNLLQENGEFHILDQRANGVVLGEGAGVVLLKPLSQAEQDGDRIYAVIDGLAVNNDGRTAGPATPNIEAQRAVMQAALQQSGCQPTQVQYLDVNGSGSQVTDILEMKAVASIYRADSSSSTALSSSPLYLGSMKPNIGHPLCAEGMASFIKTVLMVHHQCLVPFLSGQEPLEHFSLAAAQCQLPREQQSMPLAYAAINCFADGGTNAHVILKHYETHKADPVRSPLALPTLNRRDVRSLQQGQNPALAAAPLQMKTLQHGFARSKSWSQQLTVDHPVLGNHRIYGQAVLPGLAWIDFLYQWFAEEELTYNTLELRHLSIYRPLVVTEMAPAQLTVEALPQEAGYWQLTVRDQRASATSEAIYITAEIHPVTPHAFVEAATLPPMAHSANSPGAAQYLEDNKNNGQLAEIYQHYHREQLSHSAIMKPSGHFYLDSESLWVYVTENNQGQISPAEYLFHPALIDGSALGLGWLGASLVKEETGKGIQPTASYLFLPLYYESFYASEPLKDKCYARVQRASLVAKGELITFTVEFFTVTGKKIAELNNLSTKRVRNAEFLGQSQQPSAQPAYSEALSVAIGATTVASREGVDLAIEETADTATSMKSFLTSVVAAHLGVDPRTVDLKAGYYELGLDSALLLEVVKSIASGLALNLSPTLLFEYTTIDSLAKHLMATYGDSRLVASPVAPEAALKKQVTDQSVAVIGMAGRYPKAENLNAFWENLKAGKDCITEIPAERWNSNRFDQMKSPSGKNLSKWGGFIDDVDCFDAEFFRVSPREAKFMDPQERLFLEVCWEAMEDAGYTPENMVVNQVDSSDDQPRCPVGVFAGVMHKDYTLLQNEAAYEGQQIPLSLNMAQIANRVSYFCNFHGPSITIDTACSSSLTAVHLAIEQIHQGKIQLALAGGVNLSLHPGKYQTYGMMDMHASDGYCHTFGEGGDGYVSAEGVGAVLLKPLAQALADKDSIYAVIKGSSINHVGKVSGMTVPSPVAQGEMIAECLKNTGVDPETITYIEAHGTGTSLGDPIEIQGLNRAFKASTAKIQYCALGSVKSNMGHAEAAAGICGLTKAILQLHHKTRVKTLHAEAINPYLDLASSPFYIQQTTETWQLDSSATASVRRAGVSSFGASGSNAHLILEEAPSSIAATEIKRPRAVPVLVPLSASNNDRLRAYADRLLGFLEAHPSVDLVSLAYTLQTGRVSLEQRLIVLASNVDELQASLTAFLDSPSASIANRLWQGRAQSKGTGSASLEVDASTKGEGGLDRIRQWAAQGTLKDQLEQVAQAWVQGYHLDWHALYEELPQRLHLPTYPFAKKRHWIDVPGQKHNTRQMIDKKSSANQPSKQPGTAQTSSVISVVQHPLTNTNMSRNTFSAPLNKPNNITLAPLVGSDSLSNRRSANNEQSTAMSENRLAARASGMTAATKKEVSKLTASGAGFAEVPAKPAFSVDSIQSTLIASLARALFTQPEDITIDKPFVDMGLDSIVGVEWIQSINKTYAINLPATKVYDYPTISEFSHFLQQELTRQEYQPAPDQNVQLTVSDAHKHHRETVVAGVTEAVSVLDGKAKHAYSLAMLQQSLKESLATALFMQPDDIAIDKPFVDMGLDSIVGVEWIQSINKTYETNLPATKVYDYPTMSEFATFLQQLLSQSEPRQQSCAQEVTPSLPTSQPKLAQPEIAAEPTLDSGSEALSLHNVVDVNYRAPSASDEKLPEHFGSSLFQQRYGCQLSYFTGSMYRAIASEALVVAMGQAGLLSFFGSAGLSLDALEQSIQRIQAQLGETKPYGMCLIANLNDPQKELDQAETFIRYQIPVIEAAAFSTITPALVYCRVKGLTQTQEGRLILPRRIIGKCSRLEVARLFLSRPPMLIVNELVAKGMITEEEAHLSQKIPMVDDLAVEADSGGHTDQGVAFSLLPSVMALKASMTQEHHYPEPIMVGCGGGIGTPQAVAAAFALGADFIFTGSINQCTVESGAHPAVKAILSSISVHDTTTAPAGDMFEIGAMTQVVKKGTQFPQRASRLYQIFHQYSSIEAIPQSVQRDIEQHYFKRSFAEVWDKVCVYKARKNPEQLLEAQANPRIKMKLIFQWYFHYTNQVTLAGTTTEQDNFQIHSGPALGAFNQWVKGTELENWQNRPVVTISQLLMTKACEYIQHKSLFTTSAKTENGISRTSPQTEAIHSTPYQSQDFFAEQAIAIIGMSGQFPQAKNLDQFWENIAEAKQCVSEIPAARWQIDQYFDTDKDAPGKTYSRWLGVLEDIDVFDPLFFNISPAEAKSMDPQQRLFLQNAWHCIENAGLNPATLSDSACGVFVGCSGSDYSQALNAQGLMGVSSSILSARIAYLLNLKGPCSAIDTACSSSLVAIAEACNSLVLGTSDLAIAGGVCILTGPSMHIMTSKAGMLSEQGRCFTFDDRADGFVPGEGVGVILLKRLHEAVRDRDVIHGVIKGWGVNQDGRTNGMTAPSVNSQIALEKGVYDRFGINPETISLVEAHGTGTKLGDPIEVEALISSFSAYTQKTQYCALGSVKSNIGHLLPAAGVSGVIKAVLALQKKMLPPNAQFSTLNRHITLDNSPFYINTALRPWHTAPGIPRCAAVSSFGFSGTNAHLVIQEYAPELTEVETAGSKNQGKTVNVTEPVLVTLSAKNRDRLSGYAANLISFLKCSDASLNLADLAYTYQTGREAMDERIALLVDDKSVLIQLLEVYCEHRLASDNSNQGILYQGAVDKTPGLFTELLDDEDGQALVDQWMKQKNLSKLAKLWVKGLDIDWQLLYDNRRPSRIVAPNYPFAQQRYWLETQGSTTASSVIAEQSPLKRASIYLRPSWCRDDSQAYSRPLASQDSLSSANIDHRLLLLHNHDQKVMAERLQREFTHGLLVQADSIQLSSLGDLSGYDGLIDLTGLCLQPTQRLPEKLQLLQALIDQRRGQSLRLLYLGIKDAPTVEEPLYCMLQSEYRTVTARCLVVAATDVAVGEEALMQQVMAEYQQEALPSLCHYQQQQRLIPVLEQMTPNPGTFNIPADRVVWITGGTRGIGLLCAQHMVAHYGVKKLVLHGKAPLPGRGTWERYVADPAYGDSSTQQKIEAILALEAQGIQVEIQHTPLTDTAQLQQALAMVNQTLGQVAVVLHCAGLMDQETPAFIHKTWDNIEAVLAPKVQGLIHLHEVMKTQPLQRFVLFSSVSAIMPRLAVGQLDYAMANGFMDNWSRHQHQAGNTYYLSLQWPSWKETGMGEVRTQVYRDTGLLSHTNAEGLALLDGALTQSDPVLLPAVVNPAIFNAAVCLQHSMHQQASAGLMPTPLKSEQEKTTEEVLRQPAFDTVAVWVQQLVSQLINLDLDKLDRDKPFQALGIDSILIAQLIRQMDKDMVGEKLDPSIVLENPTVNQLAGYLIQHHGSGLKSVIGHPSTELGGETPLAEVQTNSTHTKPVPLAELENTSQASQKAVSMYTQGDSALLANKIAVVGMACHFPDAPTTHDYWENLLVGRDSMTDVPVNRWDPEKLYLPGEFVKGFSISRWGAFLDKIEYFDPDYFGISRSLAPQVDPLARQWLEVSAEALADSGYTKEALWGENVGVFVGSRMSNFAHKFAPNQFDKNAIVGLGQNFIAAHLAHIYNFKGPNMVVDTACASSLTAIHLAVKSLREGESTVALAGGVDILLDESPYILLSAAQALSPDGRCKTFDESANGIGLGEGCGVLILKRLSQAIADGNKIYGVIEGSAVNNDGATMGVTTPNPEAQEALIEAAIADAGIAPQSISYVEAHGTGTLIGDPIELKGLSHVFRKATDQKQFCSVGSVKSNLGHLLSAAGVAGIIKILLSIVHKQLPQTLHCHTPNSRFQFAQSPLYPVLENQVWAGPLRRAGISAFGLGGNNAHIVLSAEGIPDALLATLTPKSAMPEFQRNYYWPTKPATPVEKKKSKSLLDFIEA
ncbi:PfaD family polyunsaturated fatty acid/polyketide biosynthesis protein [Spartinivicinus poritis]|uniref:PfaD family polyunsaturated fatty acid/polyketide biosynthesis protein n=1 Tax=Spartinivicinus poritis TaxID=2994640 RepID=A0ABT5U870_9GAMM|nr:PfaD family polyunsaturated fatty acid/polyketide biosynthesis protein [Spartinivicinus sp. A2-2]MDE1462573.1 PfaD family polyunsaturated fatty acid/polyketide biosynthesis protein [Spartinivicinus sp. A2-2]